MLTLLPCTSETTLPVCTVQCWVLPSGKRTQRCAPMLSTLARYTFYPVPDWRRASRRRRRATRPTAAPEASGRQGTHVNQARQQVLLLRRSLQAGCLNNDTPCSGLSCSRLSCAALPCPARPRKERRPHLPKPGSGCARTAVSTEYS